MGTGRALKSKWGVVHQKIEKGNPEPQREMERRLWKEVFYFVISLEKKKKGGSLTIEQSQRKRRASWGTNGDQQLIPRYVPKGAFWSGICQ